MPDKSKHAPAVMALFRKMLDRAAPSRPRQLQTDKNKNILTPYSPIWIDISASSILLVTETRKRLLLSGFTAQT